MYILLILSKKFFLVSAEFHSQRRISKKYGLLFSFKSSLRDQEQAIAKGVEFLSAPDTKTIMHTNRERFLQDKIDVTAFMVWFIENYPDSFHTMRENPGYQYRFR